ncbi:hypothetical protein [Actinomadura atramentaria]|uniref:hypothetical protein n=1 Tax=Actinomadura atramentaria TaxID=1990 RepID=UPI00036525BC|nr:hypothetical protein [Actinomadura atramentaria]
MIIVNEYSDKPLDDLPAAGRERIREVERNAPDAVLATAAALIADSTGPTYTYAKWADFTAAARDVATLTSVFNPVRDAERAIVAEWRDAALARTGAHTELARRLSARWSNCGMTSVNVMTALRGNYTATISLTERFEFRYDTAGEIARELNRVPAGAGEIHLLDCDLSGIHNFVVEVHHDGSRYLVQGYQGGYSALWWVTDSVYDPVEADTVRTEALSTLRGDWGGGRNIAARHDGLVANLTALIKDGYNAVTRAGSSVWRQLPFGPHDQAPLAYKDAPFLRVDRFVLRNPAAVRAAANGVGGALSVQGVRAPLSPVPPADPADVVRALAELGLTATHSVEDRSGASKFKVTDDRQAQALKNKLVTRVGTIEVDRLTPAALPARGSQAEVGYLQAGVERTTTRQRA